MPSASRSSRSTVNTTSAASDDAVHPGPRSPPPRRRSASAGASSMPSPTMMVDARPARPATASTFSSGDRSARSVDPDRRADRLGHVGMVAGDHDHRSMPAATQRPGWSAARPAGSGRPGRSPRRARRRTETKIVRGASPGRRADARSCGPGAGSVAPSGGPSSPCPPRPAVADPAPHPGAGDLPHIGGERQDRASAPAAARTMRGGEAQHVRGDLVERGGQAQQVTASGVERRQGSPRRPAGSRR